MPEYHHLFFDLDHTLWDTNRNSQEALKEIYSEITAEEILPEFDAFLACYRSHNEKLWGLYAENKIGREAVRINRFRFTLEDFNIRNYSLAEKLADEFIQRTPKKTNLLDNTLQVLDTLSAKYPLSVITNGFKESQQMKLNSSGLKKYFKHIFISEEIGFNKPDPRVFIHAMDITGVLPHNALMIGDTYETDIVGANNAGIDQVYLKTNPDASHRSTYHITGLLELLSIV